jgi:hypothetical protein
MSSPVFPLTARKFFLAHEAPDYGTLSPSFAGFTAAILSPYGLWPQVPSSETRSLHMSSKQLARQHSNECCQAPWRTRSV